MAERSKMEGQLMKKEKLTTLQYQQKVIHLQSEVSKYRQLVKNYEENYHYHLLNELKLENSTLSEKNNNLKKEMEKYQLENKKLFLQLTKLRDEIESYKLENSKLKEEISKLIKEREELKGLMWNKMNIDSSTNDN